MELVPFISIKNKKLYRDDRKQITLDEIVERLTHDQKLYVLDRDGIERDKPNLSLYPNVSNHLPVWVDAGPRVLGDVVDIVMAGASMITIRRNRWSELDVSSVREVTENEIYADVALQRHEKRSIGFSFFQGVDGLVLFDARNQIERDFIARDVVKQLCAKYALFAHEADAKNVSYWKHLGAKGLIVNLGKIQEFKTHEF